MPNVGVVINLNVPADPSDYVHRVGRTSRRGTSYIQHFCDVYLTKNEDFYKNIYP